MAAGLIDIDRQGGVAIVILRYPPANAMNIELTEELASAFQTMGSDRSVNSVVLTGQGKSFCAGVDLKTVPHFDAADQRRMVEALNRAFHAVYSFTLPVVAAVPSNAIAGGLVLALCCDWRLAVDTHFLLGLTEVSVGVPYPVAAMEVVRQELRPEVARRLVLSGKNVTSFAGLEAGLLDETVKTEELLPRALAAANAYAALPPPAFAASKRQLRLRALLAMEAAIAGSDPLLNGWLPKETAEAAVRTLRGKA
jgi:enoyl-CoA hydratase/carnithine racemase